MTQTPAGWYPVDEHTERFWDGQEWAGESRAKQPAPVDHQPQTVIVSDSRFKPIQLTLAWVVAVLTGGYMLPWAIAATRGKSNAGAIGWLNLLLGWTVVGWIVALVMACGAHQKFAVPR